MSTAAPSQQATAPRPHPRRRSWSPAALVGAWWQLVALGVLYCVCVRTATGQTHENLLHDEALGSRGSATGWLGRAFDLLERLEPVHLVIGIVAVGAVGVLRGRPGRAAQGVAVAAGTLGLTELLKLVLLDRPALGEGFGAVANSLPSGHTSAVLGLALGALVVVPRWLRLPTALAGAAVAGSMGAFVIADAWHRVSDVLGSALVGSVVFCLVQAWPSRDRRRRGRLVTLSVVVPAACAAALAVVYAGDAGLRTSYLVSGAVVTLTVLLAGRALPGEVRRGG